MFEGQKKHQAPNAAKEFDGLIAGILSEAIAEGSGDSATWKNPAREVRRLARKDYVRSLRRNLNYRDVVKLVEAFDEIAPGFNKQPLSLMSVEEFAAMAARMKIHFKASPWGGEEGLMLRGFYVTAGQANLKMPLIYINTAHHPLAVCATILHELGHHMSTEIFEIADEPVHFFFDSGYLSHLDETGELAADAVVSFAAYPEPFARKIFETPWNWGLVARAKNLTEAALNEVRRHLKNFYGFELMEHLPSNQQLHYMSGMIHYAKLRWALLAEYDI